MVFECIDIRPKDFVNSINVKLSRQEITTNILEN